MKNSCYKLNHGGYIPRPLGRLTSTASEGRCKTKARREACESECSDTPPLGAATFISFSRIVLLTFLAIWLPLSAQAQAFPSEPLPIIVPFAPQWPHRFDGTHHRKIHDTKHGPARHHREQGRGWRSHRFG